MRILFLSTWFPYPPVTGATSRAYHLLRALATRHAVALISFRDREIDAAALDHLRDLCVRVEIVDRHPFASNRIRAVAGLLSVQPRFLVGSRSEEMMSRVVQMVENWRPDTIVGHTVVTASYAVALPRRLRPPRGLVIDIDNLLTRMAREESSRALGVRRIRRWLTSQKAMRYERRFLREFALCLTTCLRDRRVVQAMLGYVDGVVIVPNGADVAAGAPRQHASIENTVVYPGAVTYSANLDAVEYFVRDILPLVRRRIPDVQFTVTGGTHGIALERFMSKDHVRFTGHLEDVREVVANSGVCVVPLRMGGGTRVKILEAMALGTPVVSTSKGAEGLEVVDGEHLLIGDSAPAFADQVVRLLRDPALAGHLAGKARGLVETQYNWDAIGRQLCQLVENLPSQ